MHVQGKTTKQRKELEERERESPEKQHNLRTCFSFRNVQDLFSFDIDPIFLRYKRSYIVRTERVTTETDNVPFINHIAVLSPAQDRGLKKESEDVGVCVCVCVSERERERIVAKDYLPTRYLV